MKKRFVITVTLATLWGASSLALADSPAAQPPLSCEEQYLNLQENYGGLLSGNATVQRKLLQVTQQLQQLQAEKAKAQPAEPPPAAPALTEQAPAPEAK